MFGIISIWLLFSIIIALGAGSRGRSSVGWFLLAAIFSPLLAGLLLLLLPSLAGTSSSPAEEQVSPRTHVRCPECRELVRMDASKCKHCGCSLIPQRIDEEVEDGSAATGRAIVITAAAFFLLFALIKCSH